MPAIPYKKTGTTDTAWDGPANEKNLSNDEADLRAAFAWVDPEGDATTKDAYRFIHHEISSDGSVGDANLGACSSGIAVLNGGRSGTTIPDADKEGVHAHLAHHLEDAGKEAPELKSARRSATSYRGESGRGTKALMERVERRVPGTVEVRAGKSGSPMIVGYAAVFDAMTTIDDWFGSYAEKCGRGCFSKTLADGADVRALYNHDPNFVLGRTKSGTLRLSEDDHGLAYECDPPDTAFARDLMETMRRGDVDGSSFGFRVMRNKWTTIIDPSNPDPNEDGDLEAMDCRTLLEVQLFDVSPVAFPAYPQTDSSVRSALAGAGFDLDNLSRVVLRGHRGLLLSTRDRGVVRDAIAYLRRFMPSESQAATSAPVRTGHPPTPQSVAPAPASQADQQLLVRLANLEKIAITR